MTFPVASLSATADTAGSKFRPAAAMTSSSLQGKKTFQTYTSGYLFNGYIFSITVEYSFNNNLLNVQCEELPVLKLSFYHELSVSLPIACTQPKQTFNNGMQKHMKSITEGLSTVFSGSKINSLDGKDWKERCNNFTWIMIIRHLIFCVSVNIYVCVYTHLCIGWSYPQGQSSRKGLSSVQLFCLACSELLFSLNTHTKKFNM